MTQLNFKSCLADPDAWMRPATKADGQECFECTLLHTDNVLCISENPETTMQTGVGKCFELKEESIGPPTIHLGGHMRQVTLDNQMKAWAFSSSQCVQASVKNIKNHTMIMLTTLLCKSKSSQIPVRSLLLKSV